ncbi:FAD-dependent oxidoreductase, partial [Myxococcota bacterium]|nr:FAD-dependent oxidoreductase [Myxococcota bacterium]
MSLKDVLAPFSTWVRAFSKPYTVPVADTHREGADRYRGWHINDTATCVGCGTCADICQNEAIDMVVVDQAQKGDSGLRPLLDYGRCCWCALCVDVCPSGSLGMSNEYSWSDSDPEVFRYIPGVNHKAWDGADKGWRKDARFRLVEPKREPIPMLEVTQRPQTWAEVVIGYTEAQAQKEAARCVECGICISACPAHMRIPDYIKAIREGDYAQAVQEIYENNPMPEMCGKVCTRRCEDVCTVGLSGDPVAIRWLKRFATERFDDLSEVVKPQVNAEEGRGKKVGIIGGGPSGFTVAYYLAIRGYAVTLYEALPKLGGATFFGIPKYRFPVPSLDKQVQMLIDAGVELRVNHKVQPEEFAGLREEYDALFIGTGLMKAHKLRAEGEDLEGVRDALSFLRDHHLSRDVGVKPGDKVIVVGGGNTAVDSARVSRRLGASEVIMAYRRRFEDMPADWEELEDAEAEEVLFMTQNVPLRVERRADGRLDYVWGPAEMVPSERPGGRPSPQLIEGVEHRVICDHIIVAVGQGPDLSWLPSEAAGVIGDKRGWIAVNEDGMTGMEGVFAGGDLVNNTADAISAIADGLRAVDGIRYLTGGKARPVKAKVDKVMGVTLGLADAVTAAIHKQAEIKPELKVDDQAIKAAAAPVEPAAAPAEPAEAPAEPVEAPAEPVEAPAEAV